MPASAAICRDDKGVYLGASVTVFDGLVDLECLEAHACCEAFALATDLQLRRVKVATDCLATVNHLYGNFMGSSATIIRDIKLRMRQVDESEVVHEARESILKLMLWLRLRPLLPLDGTFGYPLFLLFYLYQTSLRFK